MNRMLIDAARKEQVRVALVEDKTLNDFIVERLGFEQKKANIYKARITRIEPSLEAVFVNYGADRHGFLPLKEISKIYFRKPPKAQETKAPEASKDETSADPEDNSDGNVKDAPPKEKAKPTQRSTRSKPNINDLLKEGQEIMIQVVKEERGQKGAALTTFISLAGSYLVLMPNNPRSGGISRRIEGDERDDLRDVLNNLTIPDGMSLIIRTAGVGKSTEELQWDLDVLVQHWEAITAASDEHAAPFLIHQESDIIIRAVRDYLKSDIAEIIINDSEVFERVKHYLEQVRPDFCKHLKLDQEETALFSRYQIERQIETAYQRSVRLPSGGSIVIDQTEAMVCIDVNSSKATKGSHIEETALNTNREAAVEIAKQMRLRDIGGLLVIDFIDMSQVRHQRDVETHLRTALKQDRARIQIGRISRFGLLEMSRQRLRPSIAEAVQSTCPRCEGQGTIRGIESLAFSLIRILEEDALKKDTREIQVQMPVDLATYLLNERREEINAIEQQQDMTILVIPNPHMQTPQYNIRRLRGSRTGRSKMSYSLVETPKAEMPSTQKPPQKPVEQPAVSTMLPKQPRPTAKKPASGGLIKRIWQSMVGAEEPEKPKPKHTRPPSKRPHSGRSHARRGHQRSSGSRGKPQQQTRRGTRGGRRPPSGQSRSQSSDSSRPPRSGTHTADKKPADKPSDKKDKKD